MTLELKCKNVLQTCHTHPNCLMLKEICDKCSSEFAERGGISVSHTEFIFIFTKFSQVQNLYYIHDT
jgi:hypothetical protein